MNGKAGPAQLLVTWSTKSRWVRVLPYCKQEAGQGSENNNPIAVQLGFCIVYPNPSGISEREGWCISDNSIYPYHIHANDAYVRVVYKHWTRLVD